MVRTALLEHAPFCGRRVCGRRVEQVSIEPFYIVLPGGCLLFFSTAGLRWFYDVDGVAVTRCRVWPMLPVSQARETLVGWPLSKNIRKAKMARSILSPDRRVLAELMGGGRRRREASNILIEN